MSTSPQTVTDAPAPIERGRHACAECKARKLRCSPSLQVLGVCHRCHRMGMDCIIPEVRKRTRKPKLKSRVDELEERHNKLMELVVNTKQSPKTVTDSAGDFMEAALESQPSFQSVILPPTASPSRPISVEQAIELIEYYRQVLTLSFPFVVLPADLSIVDMRRLKPVLFKGVLLVSAWRSRPLQLLLEKDFLVDIATRFFIHGERSLDLLQGLMVYLAWYQYSASQASQQAYRFSSIAVTLLIDLGLHRRPRGPTNHERIVDSLARDIQANPTTFPKFWSHEAQRAFLGTYVLSTFCALLYRKVNILRHSQYLEECALSLTESEPSTRNVAILHYVRLLRISTVIHDTFDYSCQDKEDKRSDEEIQILVRALEGQLADWRASLPDILIEDVRLKLCGHIANAYLHEVGLYGVAEGEPLSITRITILYRCLDNVKDYITMALNLSIEDMQGWTSFEWRQLNYAVMIGSRITLTLDLIACTNDSASRIFKLDGCLEQLCSRARTLFTMTNTLPDQSHYFQRLSMEWQGMRNWFRPAIHRLANSTSNGQDHLQMVNHTLQSVSGHVVAMPWTPFGGADTWAQDDFWLQSEWNATYPTGDGVPN